jgi:general secretion pathway protein C
MLAALLLLAATAPPPDLQLVGLVLASVPERSVAILQAGGRSRSASPGESAFGGRVVAVTRAGATVDFDGRRVELALTAGPIAPRLAEPSFRPPGPTGEAAPGTQILSRKEVDRRLSGEIPRILAETTVVPVMEEGRVTGLAITRMPEGTLLTEAGLRPGDVLKRINDVEIDGMATLIGLWPRLQGATELRAEVLRNGQLVPLSVTLR